MDYPVYTFFFRLLLPLLALRLLIKSVKEPGYRASMAERFGKILPHRPDPIWIHGVSVGEIQAASPLIEHFHRQGDALLVTTTTAAGRKTAENLYGAFATVAWLPYDDPIILRRFLSGYRPRIALIMETELWPNLLRSCRKAEIPTWIVNARLSPRSTRRYRKIASTTQSMLADLTGIVAQSPRDDARFKSLGGHTPITVSGNLKFDRAPSEAQIALGDRWRQRLNGQPVVVFASTRDGEEALALDAIAPLVARNIVPVIVPRHPARFDAVAGLITAAGYRCRRRSSDDAAAFEPSMSGVVWLGDSLGEMSAYYRLADVAVIGGSWLPFGGQNPLEAIAVGTPAIVGPHTEHFADLVDDGLAAGAFIRCDTLPDAVSEVLVLLDHVDERRRRIDAGTAFLNRHRGALKRTLAEIEPSLEAVKKASGFPGNRNDSDSH